MSKALLKGLALTLRHFSAGPSRCSTPTRDGPCRSASADGGAACPRGRNAPLRGLRTVRKDLPEPLHHRLCRNGPDGRPGACPLQPRLIAALLRLCVEACPVEAIAMSSEYELAAFGREPLVCNTERLLPRRPNGEERP